MTMPTTTTSIERPGWPPPGRLSALLAMAVLAIALPGCGAPPADTPAGGGQTWSVTAWGERFEVFPEVDPLVAGEPAVAHTHVTRLDGFEPLVDGSVEIVLTGPAGAQAFGADRPARPGIFAVEIAAPDPGDYELTFRVRDAAGSEEIRGGRVRVGTAEAPGGVLVAPAPRGGSDGGEPLPFLKEEQWRSDFATAWVRSGRLAHSVAGLARIRPPAGGESTLSAPVDGVVRPPSGSGTWPFAGLRVRRGEPLFRIAPLIAAERSLAGLEADLATLSAELGTARARLARLEELLELEATSRREVEEARLRVDTLETRRSAAARDLAAARSARQGRPADDDLTLRAPFAGEIARVAVTPGATVGAGEPLARLVRTDVVWIETALPPAGARRLSAEGVRGIVLHEPEHGPVRIEDGLRLVSVAPEISPSTGTLAVLLEAPGDSGLPLGATLDAQVLSAESRDGIVIPASALVDDGGVPVVYLQLSGERFVRQEVHVVERQGERLLVDHLQPGQRLVTRGGESIRRASLMASGQAHGHVH